jgi:hypothetical protein
MFIFLLHSNIFSSTHFSYYTLLTDAFLHGRTYILPIDTTFDLSFFEGKWYLYWGASPVLFILPFFLIGQGLESDIFYTLVAGILNIFLFAFVVKEFLAYTKYSLTPFFWWMIIGSFALASPNFYLSMGGKVWHTGQVISLAYLLLFLWMFFKFLTAKKIAYVYAALFFFHLAWLGRISLLFYGVLFLYLFKKDLRALTLRALPILFAGVAAGGLLFGWYNIARFHSPLEMGARFQHAHPRYYQKMVSGQFFSIKNIPHNVWHYFIESPFSLKEPGISLHPEGISVFFVYPFTLFFLISLWKKGKGTLHALLPFFYITLLLLMGFLLLFLGTGWYQFGSRYFFDLIPLVFLCSIPVIQRCPKYILFLLLGYGIFINVLGITLFYIK